MTLSQVNGGGKVAAPRVLLPYHFRPSIYSDSFFFPEFHTIYENTLSCTCLMPRDKSEASFGELLLFFECQDPFGSIGTF